MNEKQYPDFKNKNLRLAIAQAIDKKGYVDSVKEQCGIPSDTLTAKGIAKAPYGQDYASTMNSPLKYNPKKQEHTGTKLKKS